MFYKSLVFFLFVSIFGVSSVWSEDDQPFVSIPTAGLILQDNFQHPYKYMLTNGMLYDIDISGMEVKGHKGARTTLKIREEIRNSSIRAFMPFHGIL